MEFGSDWGGCDWSGKDYEREKKKDIKDDKPKDIKDNKLNDTKDDKCKDIENDKAKEKVDDKTKDIEDDKYKEASKRKEFEEKIKEQKEKEKREWKEHLEKLNEEAEEKRKLKEEKTGPKREEIDERITEDEKDDRRQEELNEKDKEKVNDKSREIEYEKIRDDLIKKEIEEGIKQKEIEEYKREIFDNLGDWELQDYYKQFSIEKQMPANKDLEIRPEFREFIEEKDDISDKVKKRLIEKSEKITKNHILEKFLIYTLNTEDKPNELISEYEEHTGIEISLKNIERVARDNNMNIRIMAEPIGKESKEAGVSTEAKREKILEEGKNKEITMKNNWIIEDLISENQNLSKEWQELREKNEKLKEEHHKLKEKIKDLEKEKNKINCILNTKERFKNLNEVINASKIIEDKNEMKNQEDKEFLPFIKEPIKEFKILKDLNFQKIMRDSHNLFNKSPVWGTQFTRDFEKFIKNQKDLSRAEKDKILQKIEEINKNKVIKNLITHYIRSTNISQVGIERSLKSLGIKISRTTIGKIALKDIFNNDIKKYNKRFPGIEKINKEFKDYRNRIFIEIKKEIEKNNFDNNLFHPDLLSIYSEYTQNKLNNNRVLKANSGFYLTRRFKKFVKNLTDFDSLKKRELLHRINIINEEKIIEKYILHQLKINQYSASRIGKMEKIEGLSISNHLIKDLIKRYNLKIRISVKESKYDELNDKNIIKFYFDAFKEVRKKINQKRKMNGEPPLDSNYALTKKQLRETGYAYLLNLTYKMGIKYVDILNEMGEKLKTKENEEKFTEEINSKNPDPLYIIARRYNIPINTARKISIKVLGIDKHIQKFSNRHKISNQTKEKIKADIKPKNPDSLNVIANKHGVSRGLVSEIAIRELGEIEFAKKFPTPESTIPEIIRKEIIKEVRLENPKPISILSDKLKVSRGAITNIALKELREEEFQKKFPKDIPSEMGKIIHKLINNLITEVFDNKRKTTSEIPKIYSEPRIYQPNSQIRTDCGFINRNNYFKNLLTDKIIQELKINLEKLDYIKFVQFDYTSMSSNENIIEKILKYEHPEIMLFIVGTKWFDYWGSRIKELPKDERILYPENIRIINAYLFADLLDIQDKNRDKFNLIIDLNEREEIDILKDILEDEDLKLHDTQELMIDLNKKENFNNFFNIRNK